MMMPNPLPQRRVCKLSVSALSSTVQNLEVFLEQLSQRGHAPETFKTIVLGADELLGSVQGVGLADETKSQAAQLLAQARNVLEHADPNDLLEIAVQRRTISRKLSLAEVEYFQLQSKLDHSQEELMSNDRSKNQLQRRLEQREQVIEKQRAEIGVLKRRLASISQAALEDGGDGAEMPPIVSLVPRLPGKLVDQGSRTSVDAALEVATEAFEAIVSERSDAEIDARIKKVVELSNQKNISLNSLRRSVGLMRSRRIHAEDVHKKVSSQLEVLHYLKFVIENGTHVPAVYTEDVYQLVSKLDDIHHEIDELKKNVALEKTLPSSMCVSINTRARVSAQIFQKWGQLNGAFVASQGPNPKNAVTSAEDRRNVLEHASSTGLLKEMQEAMKTGIKHFCIRARIMYNSVGFSIVFLTYKVP
jgi:hypothetical protein